MSLPLKWDNLDLGGSDRKLVFIMHKIIYFDYNGSQYTVYWESFTEENFCE